MQGVVVCENTLNELAKTDSKDLLRELLMKFNKSFRGIEVHGYLAPEEYEAVNALRKLEADLEKSA